jgi:nicotinamide mononucleotide transporter
MSLIELAGFLVTVVSIWLATRENVWYYPTGIASVLLYAWIFFSAHLYAETALQFVWLALMIYGWYEWLHGGVNRTELPVTKTPAMHWIAIAVTGLVASAAIFAIQWRFTDNPNPLVDSSIFAWSIVAQWMTARKYIENWWLWIVINIVAVPLYIHRKIYFTALLYAILFVLAFEGLRKWRRSLASA